MDLSMDVTLRLGEYGSSAVLEVCERAGVAKSMVMAEMHRAVLSFMDAFPGDGGAVCWRRIMVMGRTDFSNLKKTARPTSGLLELTHELQKGFRDEHTYSCGHP